MMDRRYDGAPAPKRNTGVGVADALSAAEDAKRDAQCDNCGHDNYNDLKRAAGAHHHTCSFYQSAPRTRNCSVTSAAKITPHRRPPRETP